MKEETKQWKFSRVLGKRPATTGVKVKMLYEPQLFAESFGPPEQEKHGDSSLLFWNFRRADGKGGFSMFAKVSTLRASEAVQVHIARRGRLLSFAKFIVFRLLDVENAIESPSFLGSGRFIISKIS